MCNIISQLFTCCNHKQFQNIYQCPLIIGQVEVQSNGNQTSDLFFCARVVPDRFSSPSSSSSQNNRPDNNTQNLRTMLILCESCPNLRRPSRPVGGYCRDCRRSHLRNGLGIEGSATHSSRLGELGGLGELPPLPRVDLTPYRRHLEESNDNGNIFVGEAVEGVDQRSASELAGLARLVVGALENGHDQEHDQHERETAAGRDKNKDGSTGRRLRRKLRGKGNLDDGNSKTAGRKMDMDKKGSISSSSDHTSGSSATLAMGMATATTLAAVGGSSSRRGGQGVGVAI